MRNVMRTTLLALVVGAALSGCAPRTGLELDIDLAGTLVPGRDFDLMKVTVSSSAGSRKTSGKRIKSDTSFPTVFYVWDDEETSTSATIGIELYQQGGSVKALSKPTEYSFETNTIVPISIVLSNQ